MLEPDIELIRQIAERHDVSVDAVSTGLAALQRGHGMAQFSHADFGGAVQWSRGGMSMVGDMFDEAMKAKLDGVMGDLDAALSKGQFGTSEAPPDPPDNDNVIEGWWPKEFGKPSASGRQNDMRYAFFPESRRLVVETRDGRATYDTGSHYIIGVSQQQQGEERKLSVTGLSGQIALGSLKVV